MANLFISVILQVVQINTFGGLSPHYTSIREQSHKDTQRKPTFLFLSRIEVGLKYLLREERLMKIPSL